MQRLLLIGHDANRAGAQLVLLQLMQQLRAKGVSLSLLLNEGGPLLADYQAVANVVIWPKSTTEVAGPVLDKVLGKLGMWQARADKQTQQQQTSVYKALQLDTVGMVLVNTAGAATLFNQLPIPGNIPVLAFMHEMAMSVQLYADPDALRKLLNRAVKLLTVSRATARYYQTTWQIPAEKIELFTLIDLPAIQLALDAANARSGELPGLANLPANALVVGGCGNAEWRKGTDLFINLARMVIRPDTPATQPIPGRPIPGRPIYFVWVGLPDGPLRDDLALDLTKADLTERVLLIPPTPDVARYMARFAVFMLCSREDPYPLVMLEAGLSGVPVVCFEKAGGAAELVETDAGVAVPYLDLTAAANALGHLLADDQVRSEQGANLRRKIQARHSLTASTGQFMALIRQYGPGLLAS